MIEQKTNKDLNKKGFTLAEVLITLAIIGVVASMSIPALMSSTNNQEHTSRLLKVYSSLSQATNLIKAENGNSLTGLFNNHIDMRDKYKEKLLNTKTCSTANNDCWHADGQFYTLDGRPWPQVDYNDSKNLISNDGTLYSFVNVSINCTVDYGDDQFERTCGWIVVDTNGFKKPNRMGIDIHRFWITQQGIYPFGTSGSPVYICDKNNTSSVWNGDGCNARILKTHSMDHLK